MEILTPSWGFTRMFDLYHPKKSQSQDHFKTSTYRLVWKTCTTTYELKHELLLYKWFSQSITGRTFVLLKTERSDWSTIRNFLQIVKSQENETEKSLAHTLYHTSPQASTEFVATPAASVCVPLIQPDAFVYLFYTHLSQHWDNYTSQ